MNIFQKIRKIGISQFVCFIFITTAMFFWSRFFSDKEFSWATIYEHREDTKMYIALLYGFISALFIHVGILSCFKFPPSK